VNKRSAKKVKEGRRKETVNQTSSLLLFPFHKKTGRQSLLSCPPERNVVSCIPGWLFAVGDRIKGGALLERGAGAFK